MWCRSMDDPAAFFAAKLREIAARAKNWEDREIQETKATTRPLYFVDLEEIATMFDGNHPRFRLNIAPKGGWQRTAQNVVRDFQIAEFMSQRRSGADFDYEASIEAVCEEFGVGDKTAERADTRFRKAIDSGADRDTILAMELLVATHRAKWVDP